MVTALDHIGHVLTKKFTLSKNKRVWFSGAGESIQMRFIQMVEQLSQFTKFAIKEFWVYNQEDNAYLTLSPVSHFDKQEKQEQPYL